jgi:hypothetical protein
MNKLTLSVDKHVVARAKAYARAHGISLSGLVQSMLEMASREVAPEAAAGAVAPMPPVLTRLRGSLKRGSLADYKRHLERKYR